jgi:hypothetical protein
VDDLHEHGNITNNVLFFSLVEFSPYEGQKNTNTNPVWKIPGFFEEKKKHENRQILRGKKGRKIYKSPDLDSELLQVKWPELEPTLVHSSDGWSPDHLLDKIQKNKTLIKKIAKILKLN